MTLETRGRSSKLPRRKKCSSYRAGHTVHYIQARKAAADGATRVEGQVTAIMPGRITVVLEDGTELGYWNHDMERVAAFLDEFAPEARVQERWALLWFGTCLVSIRRSGSTSSGCS